MEGIFTGVITARGELVASGGGKLEFLAVGTLEGVSEGIETEVASEGHGGHDIGGGDEGMSSGVSIVTASEVTVVRSDDCE